MTAESLGNPKDFWDSRYDTETYLFGTSPNRFLRSEIQRFRPGDHVLAVADGEGRNGVWLAGLGCEVLSMDVSPIAVQKAQRLARKCSVSLRFEVADLMEWPWPSGRYDTVVCVFIQFATPVERERLFRGFWTSLKPGGLVLMQGYGVNQLQYKSGGPGRIEHLYSKSMLVDAFADWDILSLREHESELDEGPKHQGMAALIDLVARKPAKRDNELQPRRFVAS